MHITLLQEQFSLAYVTAIASAAGYQVEPFKFDPDSIDCALLGKTGKRARIEVQLKATSVKNYIKDDHIAYPLPLKNYEDLRVDTWTPRMLVVLYMPEQHPQESMEWSVNELCVQHCAYWMNLRGLPEKANHNNVTVHVPLNQPLSVDNMRKLMATVEKKGA